MSDEEGEEEFYNYRTIYPPLIIGDGTYDRRTVIEIVVPHGVVIIEEDAFKDCRKLVTVERFGRII